MPPLVFAQPPDYAFPTRGSLAPPLDWLPGGRRAQNRNDRGCFHKARTVSLIRCGDRIRIENIQIENTDCSLEGMVTVNGHIYRLHQRNGAKQISRK